MRRTALTLLLAALTVALVAGAAQAAKPKKLGSLIEIELTEFGFKGSGSAEFFGDVHSSKNKCERNREVTVRNAEEQLGTVRTDRTGDWELALPMPPGPDPYVAEVARRKIKKGEKTIVCKAAESAPVFIQV
jgi:hypothetical protein